MKTQIRIEFLFIIILRRSQYQQDSLLKQYEKQLQEAVAFDVAAVGRESVGLTIALEGAKLGLKMAVFDYVNASKKRFNLGINQKGLGLKLNAPKELMRQIRLLKKKINFNSLSKESKRIRISELRQYGRQLQNLIKGLNQSKKIWNSLFEGIAAFKYNYTLLYGKIWMTLNQRNRIQ